MALSAIGAVTDHHIVARRSPRRPPRPAFPAFLAGAGRPLLPSMIDYSVFSQSAAARGSIISGPVSRSATAFNFCIQGQIRLRRHLVIGSQVGPFSRKFVPGCEK
jgi:hypothetical protein